MDGFSVGDIQLPADFDQQIAAQLAAQGYNFAVQQAETTAPATAAPNFAVQQAETAAPATAASNFAVQQGSPFGATAGLPDFSVPSNPPSFDPNVMAVDEFIPRGPPRTSTASPADLFNVNKTGMVNEQGMGENLPTFAVQPTKVDETNFTVLGNNPTRKFGQAPDGKYYFEGKEITPQDFTVLKQTNDAYLASTSAPNLTVANATGTAAPTNLAVANATGTAAPKDLAVAGSAGAVPIADGVAVNAKGLTDPAVPTITTTPTATFDYSKLSTGEPPLVAAGASYKNNATGQMVPAGTDHYVAYTNDGGFAGAVMVAPGQKIRMVDRANNNSVVFEGTGPEGAKQAVALANAMSKDKGRKAAWAIEADQTNNGNWKMQAYERYDPKNPSIFGQLLTIAAPLLLAALFPPLAGLGAALTGTVGTAATMANAAALNFIASTGLNVARGQNLGDALTGGLKQAVIAGATAGLIDKLPPGVQNVLSKPGEWINTGVDKLTGAIPGVQGALSAVNSGLNTGITAASNVTQPVIRAAGTALDAVSNLNPIKLGAEIVSGAAPATGGAPATSGVGGATNTIAPVDVFGTRLTPITLNPGTLKTVADLTGGGGKPPYDTTVDTLDVTGSTLPNITPTIPVTGGGGKPPYDTTVDTLDVDLKPKTTTTAPPVTGGGGKPPYDTTVDTLDVDLKPKTTTTTVPVTNTTTKTDTTTKTTDTTPKTGTTTTTTDPIIPLIPTGTGDGSGGGGYSILPNGPGTRGSLSSEFSRPLDLSKYAVRTPRDMSGVDFSNYGVERSFFSDVPQLPESAYAVRPSATLAPQQATLPTTEARVPSFSTIQYQLAQEKGLPPAPTGKRYIKRDDGEIILVDDSPDATYKGRSGTVKRVRDLSVYQGGSTNKPRSDFAAANLPEVIANLRSVGGLPMKRGGRAQFAVTGSGTGRSDSIPAVLSDGEYVMDAETVALLGDGSSKAGAAKLDQFRVRVRKHKGRDLARGKFSVNAKRPEAYLSGGAS
jgi:hypothetical protein